MSDNIKVVVKVRPLITRELQEEKQHQWRVNNNTLYQIDSSGRDFGQTFTFDKVYGENTKTSDVYNDVAKPIVEAAVAGFNGTIFAYGQTSSGKTYTMTGTDEAPGIIPLAVLNLFEIIKNVPNRDFVVSVSYIELYNEALRDLLDLKKTVKIQQTFSGVKVDATEKVTASPEEVLEAMKEGNANRQTASTNMNESSSRSHSIFQISIESREHIEGEEQSGCVNVSQLNLVDLAGSERAGQTGATGIRFKEGTAINMSLTSLGLVIKQLSENQNKKYINYRDSSLTRILQNSLGGNAKTSIICAITPAALEETNSTLQFANRAKTIKNKPEVNAVATDKTMIQKLTKELSELQSKLASKNDLEQGLQKKIENLQRFILNGCAQRPNVELMGGARRKLQLPRRITISTLHPVEEDVPKVPKFSTPSLKYNPSLIPNVPEWMPIQNSSKLPSLPEEPPKLVTSPPNERKVNFNNEVIELDSDDDDCSSVQTCSPYHKCYNASKTPPCILRKNAKQAERSLKDLVELTDREKMYTPSVVELMEKIDQHTTETAKLQDEIEVLKTTSKEKDLEIESLRSKIDLTEVKKLELETQCKESTTKLTDWEVSYETLKNKYKLREQELLSLLEEQRIKQADDISKIPFTPKDKEILHFMDMSKDISLVYTDNENSIVNPDDDEPTERANVIIKDMHAQLAAKDQIITDLESDNNAKKEQIQSLEKSSHDLLSQIDNFKEKLANFEAENALLQSTLKDLDCTIKSQKQNLESAQNDINSYCKTIQELQMELTKKNRSLDINISETVLESMMANEDKTIANNENIKNIIHSLKIALENSKKEIDLLKIQNNNDSDNKDTIDDFKIKTEEIELYKEEIAKFSKEANENMVIINTLLREKSDLALIEQELIKKLSELEQKTNEYDILSKEQAIHIESLKKDNEKLDTLVVNCKVEKEQLHNINEALIKQLDEGATKIMILEEDIKNKDGQIVNLNIKNDEFQDYLSKAKLAITKLQNVFMILTGDVQDLPEILDSFVNVYNSLYDHLNILENIATENMTQKDLLHKNNIKLKKEIAALEAHHTDAFKKVDDLNKSIQNLSNQIQLLNDKNNDQSNEIETLKDELNTKNIDLQSFEKQLKVFRKADILKDGISTLKGNEFVIFEEKTKLETETSNFAGPIKSQEDKQDLSKQEDEICSLQLNEFEEKLQQTCIELTQVNKSLQADKEANDQLIVNIIKKLSNIIDNIREKNSSIISSLPIEKGNKQAPNNILCILDAVVDHISLQSPNENVNAELKNKMEIANVYNKSLECELKQSSELLQQIQEQLRIKSAEIDTMQLKAQEWKSQFTDFDMAMKEQMQFLRSENERLKTKSLELNKETKVKLHQLNTEDTLELPPRTSVIQSSTNCKNNKDNFVSVNPVSLFTICYNKVIEVIDQKQNENISATTSSSCFTRTEPQPNICLECDQLNLELRTTQQENIRLISIVDKLEFLNKELTKEHSEMSDEVHSLLELTEELQKKIVNHRTNLSILTATTYTENKSLKSQVKGLQHHHSRFHNVCQRDIPEFKKQLNELMGILKDNSSFYDKRYSLPNVMENTSTSNVIRNESTLDGDLLMLDTNVTVTTADNTLVGYNQTCLDLTQTIFNETDYQTVDGPETQNLLKELELLTEQLSSTTKQKHDMEQKYNDLLLKMPSTDVLLHKIKSVEEDYKNKEKELAETINTLNAKSKQMKVLEDEFDLLSTQIMEQISEADNLNEEVKRLKQQNVDLLAQCQVLELQRNTINCPQCDAKNEIQSSMPKINESHSKQNRSLSNSDTTSRHNKICTLQNEIHAGREYCKVLTEDVVTIKHHLDHSNMSMDLDESLNFELANESVSISRQKSNRPEIHEEWPLDIYIADKNDCYNYYLEKTGIEKENISSNVKIIEVMKLFYENLVTRHGNEIENLANKLKDYEETHIKLQTQIKDISTDYLKIQEHLSEKDKSLNFITKVLVQLNDNLRETDQSYSNTLNFETFSKISEALKVKFLTVLDTEFNLSSVKVFDQIEGFTNKLSENFSSVNDILTQTKYQLSQKEKEYNLLKAQNDKIIEINKAVTLDIIRKEEKNTNMIKETYKTMLDLNMISPDKVPLDNKPINVHDLIHLLEHSVNEYKNLKVNAERSLEINDLREVLADKEKQLNKLQSQYELLQGVNNKIVNEISEKDDQVKSLTARQEELNNVLKTKVEENGKNANIIQNMSNEINKLKDTLYDKEKSIMTLQMNDAKVTELLNSVKNLQDNNEKLKAVNEMISKEAKSYAVELQKSCETIKQNNIDIDKMTSDILVLRESTKEATAHVEKLKQEVQTLTKENIEVKQNLEMKSRDCSRLEINIKTHEKTVEIQSRMITRLQKVKEEDMNELSEKYAALQSECEVLRETIKTTTDQIAQLKAAKQCLESRLAEAEESGRRSRSSIDAVARRRQSLHDSKRLFEELEHIANPEAIFGSKQKSDDFFDDDLSGRSTPFGPGKGRDSLLSRTDHSDKDDELSRPSSVLAKAARRRRQSSHDLHRSVTPHAPSPTDLSNYVIDEMQQLNAETSRTRLYSDNEITQLKARLASCEQELEELKERYRELDEECETCAEYLRERDSQCIRLKKEKTALENQVMELKTKAATPSNSMTLQLKPSVAHVSVNTDEDWANLHSVVVDRMSYDAEVEKNKKLTKIIEELRIKKQDLRNQLMKVQKEKNTIKNNRELEQMMQQLKASNDELRELRKRYKELDEECETCANYLKEREEQCRRLKESKAALQAKLEELQENSQALEHAKSVRKKRQTVHDMNRPETSTVDQIDATTETTDDFLSSQVERDDSMQAANDSLRNINSLKKMVKMLTQQKMHLELQLNTAQMANPLFVATGSAIVQNQQITDIMKENHKLKKLNAKLVNICKKRGKSADRENEDPSQLG